MASLPANQTDTRDPIRNAITAMAPEFKAALPAHVTPEKFVRVTMTAINSNPDLRQADRASLFGSVTKLAQDGLLPDGRESALVIFNTKDRASGGWVKKVQAMPMVAGLLKMMRQSGEVAWVDAQIVRANDKFQYRPGIDEMPIFEPNWFGDRGDVIGAYAIAKLKGGEIVPPEIMNRAQIDEVRNVSRSKDRGPWVDWYDQMALKTVLRRYLKRLPTSTDLIDRIERDETMQADFTPRVVDGGTVRGEPEHVAPVSRLEALEHRIEAEEIPVNDGTLADDNPTAREGRGDEDMGEHSPAWEAPLAALRVRLESVSNAKALDKVEQDWVNLTRAAVDDEDVVRTFEGEIAARRREIGQ
ncbi:rect protein [Sphingomonas sp. LH128]|uniref:recombinase RecT n=1 Tax=Sphingomonas sp. LH128 TaxID=473781 RepID=UPI00027CB13A|nr:recombinase RecT [Sphingomonas sp. LH128]EJU15132.1 rect protein [Sphingomonas sp. LH128]